MRCLVIALTALFLLSPLEAKTHNARHSKVKKSKVKGRKAPKHKAHQRTV